MARTYGAPLGAKELPLLFTRVYRALDERRRQIDALNVFPVPDADTGTNMVLTIKAGLDALRDARRRQIRDADELANVVIRGVIRGARGNSGVILSQVLRAVVEEATRGDEVDALAYARALASAQTLAYSAVVEPVSGTMLSVIAAAAAAAEQAVNDGDTLTEVSKRACDATRQAVERTPEQLAVLRDANVVDAGGRGFEVLITAVHTFLTGEQIAVARDVDANITAQAVAGCHVSHTYPYEVQYLLDADNSTVAPLRTALTPLGDSLVVVAAGNLINVHVHTADVGAVIDAGMGFAAPQNVTITDLRVQIGQAHNLSPTDPGQTGEVHLIALVQNQALGPLIGQVGGVHLLKDTPDGAQKVADTAPDAALTVFVADTKDGAMRARTYAQQRETSRRADALMACDSPLALLAAISVFDAHAHPDHALDELHAVLDNLTVTTITPHQNRFVVNGQDGQHQQHDTFAQALTGCLTQPKTADPQLVTVLFGDYSTLQHRSDVAAVIDTCCPDAEQVILDLPGADVIAWVGVE